MLKYTKKYKKDWFLIFFICSLQSIVWSAGLLSLMFLYDSIVSQSDGFSQIVGPLGGVLIWILIILISNIAVLMSSIASEILVYFCVEKMLLDIKFSLVNKINYLKYSDIETNNFNVMSLLSNDINIIENNAFNLISKIYTDILCSLIFVGILLYFNWIIAIISIFFFIMNFLLVSAFAKNTQKVSKHLNEFQEHYSSKTKNILDGINTLFFANKLTLLTSKLLVKYNKDIADANVNKVCKNDIKFSILSFTSRLLEILVIIISAVIFYSKDDLAIGYNQITSIGAILSIATLSNNLLNNSSSFCSSLISYHNPKPIFKKNLSITGTVVTEGQGCG
ncbi:MAG: hypothetical protein K2K18_01885 [Malacoplasma sp.]|nr:hypothetical protein [Malacoplasma sp.]